MSGWGSEFRAAYHNPNRRPNGRNCAWCNRPKGPGEPPGRCRRCTDERDAQRRETDHQDDC
jgi:hypothetical protein